MLVTNQVYSNLDRGGIEPAGGDTMKYSSKAIVELSHASDRYARLVKHPFMKEGQRANFKIVGKGVI